jgi:hypothetical protein
LGVAGVVVAADEPLRHIDFMRTYAGAETARADSSGFAIATLRGTIEVVTPDAFVRRFGVAAPDVSRGPRLAALRFAAADASLLQAVSELAGIAGLYAGNPAVVGSEDAMGAVLVFEPAR